MEKSKVFIPSPKTGDIPMGRPDKLISFDAPEMECPEFLKTMEPHLDEDEFETPNFLQSED